MKTTKARMKRISLGLVAAALAGALVAGAAYAHDEKTLDAMHAPNGGQLRMAGIHHYELVVARDAVATRDSPLVVYVADHADAKIPTAGARGSATIVSGRDKAVVTLVPDGDNRMKGSGRYVAAPDMKVVVSITLPGKQPVAARFTPLQRAGN